MLFSAIAQAVLSYLAANPSALAVTVGSGVIQQTGTVQLNAPWISLNAAFGPWAVRAAASRAAPRSRLPGRSRTASAGSVNAGYRRHVLRQRHVRRPQRLAGDLRVDGAGNRATGTVNIQ